VPVSRAAREGLDQPDPNGGSSAGTGRAKRKPKPTKPAAHRKKRAKYAKARKDGSGEGSNPTNPTGKKRQGRPVANAELDWIPAFLSALMEGASITRAARQANVHTTTVHQRRREDESFRAAWKEAADIGTELMEQEAARRAFHGTLRPVYQKGVRVGSVREYSDTLMIFLLKARSPAKYREGIGADGKTGSFVLNIQVVQVDSAAVSVPQGDEREAVLQLETVTSGNGDQQNDPGLRQATPVP
jgi:hypothetical protein